MRRRLLSEWTLESFVQAASTARGGGRDAFAAFHAERGVGETLQLRARCRELLANATTATTTSTTTTTTSTTTMTTTPMTTRDALKCADDRLRLTLAAALSAERLTVRVLRSESLAPGVAAQLREASKAVHVIESAEQMKTRFDSAGKLCFGLCHEQERRRARARPTTAMRLADEQSTHRRQRCRSCSWRRRSSTGWRIASSRCWRATPAGTLRRASPRTPSSTRSSRRSRRRSPISTSGGCSFTVRGGGGDDDDARGDMMSLSLSLSSPRKALRRR
jgi:hypothetical protein